MYIYETRRKFQIYKGGEFEITWECFISYI
jgi:hypothetical protein